MAIIENKEVCGIALDDIKTQSTSWLKGVKRVLAKIQASGEEALDFDAFWKEVNEELERRLSASTAAENKVTPTEPEKMREIR